jgi:hypothetical protein
MSVVNTVFTAAAMNFLHVDPYLLQLAQSLAAALVFKQGVRQFQRMADAIGIDASAYLLGDQVDVVILEVLGYAGDEGDSHGGRQQKADAADELRTGVFVVARGVGIDDVAEDRRVQQGERLVDGRQAQRRRGEFPILPQVSIENLHVKLPSANTFIVAESKTPAARGAATRRSNNGHFCARSCQRSLN